MANYHVGCRITGISKTIGRLIAVLVDKGIIERERAVWILEPLKDKAESEAEAHDRFKAD